MLFNQIKVNLIHKARKRFKPVLKNAKAASYFTITLSLFSMSFFGLFAIRPTLITAISLIKEVNDLKNLSLQYENKISNIITAQSEYEKIRESIPLIFKALPQSSEFANFARGLETIAARNKVSINQLQIDQAPISILNTKDRLSQFNFILIGVGRYDNVNSFINDGVNSLRILTINSLDLTTEGGTVSGILRMSMRGKAYYEP